MAQLAPTNQEIDAVYKAIGEAISNWTRIEIQLHALFAMSLTLVVRQRGGGYSYDGETPRAVLDSIDGFRPKLLMITAALEAALRGPDDEAKAILNDWAKEREKVNNLHGNRSKLAHWNLAQVGSPTEKVKVKFVPPVYSSRKHKGFTKTDIDGWRKAFIAAAMGLSKLCDRLASHRGLQRRFVRQVASQIRCTLPDDPTLLEYLKQQLPEHL